jgi:hypothetical protein
MNARWSGPFHIVDTRTADHRNPTKGSLESWPTETQAEYFRTAVNDHEDRNGRGRPYIVVEEVKRG